MIGQTSRQREVLQFLRAFYDENGFMPSTREVQEHFGWSSQNAAVQHLKALEAKGLIKRQKGRARALVLTTTNHES